MINFFQSIGAAGRSSQKDSNGSFSSSRKQMRQKRTFLPLYAPLAHDGESGSRALDSMSSMTDDSDSQASIPLSPVARRGADRQERQRRRQRRTNVAVRPEPPRPWLPSSRRFWADFTLGFADGLTVPFALTAGLSSLGKTDTVLFAGLAEISAGCISMGIGGYLSARPAGSAAHDADDDDDDGGEDDDYRDDSSSSSDEEAALGHASSSSSLTAISASLAFDRRLNNKFSANDPIQQYLAPLSLPADLQKLVLAHINIHPLVSDAVVEATTANDFGNKNAIVENDNTENDDDDSDDDERVWPVASGFCVALGYIIGGLLPLGPYFFVANVGDGLRWSFAVCVLALFWFGFLRDFALSEDSKEKKTSARQLSWRKQPIPWNRVWKSAYEGVQMVILGGIAAIAAVLCVRWFDGASAAS